MELTLKKAGYEYYEPVFFSPFSCETMREHIVPDSCADIARIVETTGQVRITNREVSGDGRFSAGGVVDVSVLYIPEKGDHPCALRFQLPFQSYGEGQWDGDCTYLDISGELQNIDTRLLNPRKILTRVNVILYPSGCHRTALSVCTGVQEEETIQIMREQHRMRVIAAVREKEFAFLEELTISPGRGNANEILSSRMELRGTDCKQIGSKLVVKGIIAATILYREDGGRLEQLRQELPFSQILDGSGLEDDWESESAFQLIGVECSIGGEGSADDRHILTLSLQINARVTLWKTEEIDFIADLYSTAHSVLCKTEEVILCENSQRNVRRQNIRELLETGTAVKTVLDSEIICGPVRLGSGMDYVETSVSARCLYMDENDTLLSVRREFTVKCPIEQGHNIRITGVALCGGDVMTSILPDGIEFRFSVEFHLESTELGRYFCICGVEPQEEIVSEVSPSLVLRRIGRDEKLWNVAKQYRTTSMAILEANEIDDEQKLPRDRLLLIPRYR